MLVLGWIRSDPQRWKQFVCNHVSEIHSLTSPLDWSFVPGEDNPSDLTTRGVSAERLLDSKEWLSGPSWLSEPAGHALQSDRSGVSVPAPREEEVVLTAASEPAPRERLVLAVSALDRSRRPYECWREPGRSLVTLVTPARDEISRNSQQGGWLLLESRCYDWHSARHTLMKFGLWSRGERVCSLTPFLAEGFLRVRGRLKMSDLSYEEKHPVIVPKGYLAVLLVREQHQVLTHAGVTSLITAVRLSLWVVGLPSIARRVVRGCVICHRFHSRACCETAAPLSGDRVTRAPPFTVTVVGFAGPLFSAYLHKKKLNVCLFTCAVTRAVHLELTVSLTLEEFLMASRRFPARRGVPSTVYSDNAHTFQGVNAHLQRYFGSLALVWKFIVPQSPWWGGRWERLVRSVKVAL